MRELDSRSQRRESMRQREEWQPKKMSQSKQTAPSNGYSRDYCNYKICVV